MPFRLKIAEYWIADSPQWLLWLPVLIGIGILGYFLLPFEPAPGVSGGMLAVAALLVIASYRIGVVKYGAIAVLCIALGFAAAHWRTSQAAAPRLEKPLGLSKVYATIQEVEPLQSGKRFLLKEVMIRQLKGERQVVRLTRMRVNVRTKDNAALPGDFVAFLVIPSPPPPAVIPGGYDFAKVAYFRQIGAVGYAVGPVEIRRRQETSPFTESLMRLRYHLSNRITRAMQPEEGAVAAALLVGEQTGISKQVMDDMRESGLAHLLSISGLHMVLVTAAVFFMSRALLAAIPWLALRVNIKKWAAVIALLAGTVYLLISGMPIPAQRAYIMSAFVLLAIMLDRMSLSVRAICLAAAVLLLLFPESLIGPSFQMSFAATLALIVFYEKRLQRYDEQHPFFRALHYVWDTALASLVAGMATAPFGIYHFNRYALYGILANMAAIPISSFWVMPWGMLSFLLMPFGLEVVALKPMEWGITVINWVAHVIAELPFHMLYVPAVPGLAVGLVALGALWYMLWRQPWRKWGVGLALLGMILAFFGESPEVIIDQRGKLFALKGTDGLLYISSRRHAVFARDSWLQRNGQEEALLLEEGVAKGVLPWKCEAEACVYQLPGRPEVLMQRGEVKFPGGIISPKDLEREGTHTLTFREGRYMMKTARSEEKGRLWN